MNPSDRPGPPAFLLLGLLAWLFLAPLAKSQAPAGAPPRPAPPTQPAPTAPASPPTRPDSARPAPADSPASLLSLGFRIETLRDLRDRDRLTAPVFEAERAAALAEARAIGGADLTEADLTRLARAAEDPGALARLRGALTFLNLVTFLAAMIFVSAASQLFIRYLWPLFRDLPRWVYEVTAHGASAGITLAGTLAGPLHGEWIALLGCLLWGVAATFTFVTRRAPGTKDEAFTRLTSFLCAIWSGAALLYQSEMLAHLGVAAGLATLGFRALVLPGVLLLGYTKERSIPRTMLLAAVALIGGIAGTIAGTTGPAALFFPAIVRLAGLAYLVSLLIVANRFFSPGGLGRYLGFQVLAIASCLGLAWCGSVYGIDVLRRYAGSTLALYIAEKYWEFPWGKTGRVWALLGFSGLLYAGALVARSYPEYFLIG